MDYLCRRDRLNATIVPVHIIGQVSTVFQLRLQNCLSRNSNLYVYADQISSNFPIACFTIQAFEGNHGDRKYKPWT